MAQLTRDTFRQFTDGIVERARAHLTRDGYLAQVLLGFDRRGQVVLQVLVGDGDDPEALADAQRADVLVVPRLLTDWQDEIAARVQATRTVAAICVTEAWHLSVDPADVARYPRGSVAAHPDRDEVAAIAAAWPREYLTLVRVLPIDRSGPRPRLGEPIVEWDSSQPERSEVGPHLWFAPLLPQPHRR